jgi:hypothetical protein
MKTKKILLSVIIGLAVVSCQQNKTEEQVERQYAKVASEPLKCEYQWAPGQFDMKWTAFKFTEKAPVSGKFDSIRVEVSTGQSSNPADILKGAKFQAWTSTVKSGDAGRDQKIIQFFFGTFQKKDLIEAQVDSVGDKIALLSLNLNGITQPIEAQWQMQQDTMILTCSISLEKFNALGAVKSLNNACKDLHTGPDGKSMLWPEVSIEARAKLSKICE